MGAMGRGGKDVTKLNITQKSMIVTQLGLGVTGDVGGVGGRTLQY